MESNKCQGCFVEGYGGPTLLPGGDAVKMVNDYLNVGGEAEAFLFDHNGSYYCYLCHCKVTNTCYQCTSMVDVLYRDKRCKNDPYVCEKCLSNEYTNHLGQCEADGCYTIDELARDELDWIKIQEEEGRCDSF